jgi:hypothetical protein
LPNARTDEDLAGLGFIAKARRDIGYCPNRRVVETAFKSDRPERGKAMSYTDAEAKVVAEIAPLFD